MKFKFGRYGERYEECAAPQAIEAAIIDAKRRFAEVWSELKWLYRVRDDRASQVAAGTWPPRRSE